MKPRRNWFGFLFKRNPKVPERKIFALESYEPDFYTGTVDDGRQVIMGLLCPEVVACFFDAEGNFTGITKQPWKQAAPRFGADGPYKLGDPAFEAAINQQIEDWQEELGYTNEPIKIKLFADDEMGIGISELPEHLKEPDPDDEDFEETLSNWKESGNFIFIWGKDYWMSASGEVEST